MYKKRNKSLKKKMNMNYDYYQISDDINLNVESKVQKKLNNDLNNNNKNLHNRYAVKKKSYSNKNKSYSNKSKINVFKFSPKNNLKKNSNLKPIKKIDIDNNSENNNKIDIINNNNLDFLSTNKDNYFCFVISSYNNEKNITKNLLSLINQNYENWRAIYINDNSNDKTEEMFLRIMNIYDVEEKFTYIKNDTQMKQAHNKYYAYQKIKDFEICCILDGDDWLINNDALTILNNHYQKTNSLIVCSNYKRITNDKEVNNNYYDYSSEIKKSASYRKSNKWFFNHLKTGYGFLFKSIPKDYFQFNGEWLDRCTDWAEMFSAAEFAKEKVLLLKDYLYGYNYNNSILYESNYTKDKNSKKRKDIEKHILNLPKCCYELPKTFIINLLRDKKLQVHVSNQFNYFNIKNFHFFEAVEGIKNHQIINLHNNYIKSFKKTNPQSIFNPNKEHCSIGAIGLIASTLNLYSYIESKFPTLDHVTIMEDDFYGHKNLHEVNYINNVLLKDKDFIYLGTHNNEILDVYNTENEKMLTSNNIFINILNNKILYYGTYSYICSKNFRRFILKKGINYFIDNNLSLDIGFNYIRLNEVDSNLSFYLYFQQLFIPEVRKKGIQHVRSLDFYKERNINLKDYLIEK